MSKRVVLSHLLTRSFSARQHCRALLLLGHLSLLVLAVFSLLFYRERMLHFDTANYVYHLIYFQDFYTGHDRYISYLPQLLPLLAARAGWSLPLVLQVYSLSFILLYYLIYLLIVYGFRNVQGGLFLVLALTLTLRYKFYAPVGEVVISIAFVALVLGLLSSEWYVRTGQRALKIGIAMFFSALMIFVHPFGMVSLGAAWLLWLVYSNRWRYWQEYLLPLSWLLIWGGRALLRGSGTSYESGRLDSLSEAGSFLGHLSDYYVWDRFLWYLNAHYTLPLLLFIAVLVYLSVKGKWLTALLALLSWSGIAVLVLILHSYLNGPIYIMLDGYLSHLGVVMALVFILPFGKSRRIWTLLLFVLLMGFNLDRIRGVHRYYADREYLLMNIIDGNSRPDEPKLLSHMEAFDYDRLWLPWAIGIETHLMSSLRDPEQPQTLYFQNHGQDLDDLLSDPNTFLSIQYAPDTFKVEQFPPQLFLPKGQYKKVDLRGRY